MNDWIETTLGEEFEIIMGQSPSSEFYNVNGEGMPFFQGKKEFGEIYPQIEKWTTEATKRAERNDVLLSVRAPIGAVNIAPEHCGIGRGLAAIKPNGKTSNRFIFYLLKSKENELKKRGAGVTFTAITKPNLNSLPIRIPKEKSARKEIVDSLETQFIRLDAAIKSLKSIITRLQVYRQSVLKAAFEGKFSRGNSHWEWVPFSSCGKWTGGGTPSKFKKEYWNRGTVLWVSSKDMKVKDIVDTEDKITREAVNQSSAKFIPEDSLIFVVRSGILRRTLPTAIARKEVTVNQDLQAFTPDGHNVDFLYWFTRARNQHLLRTCSKSGTTVESIETSLLKKYEVPVCSLKEQGQIVAEIESRFSVIDKVEETITTALIKAERLRKSILKAAFEGKLF